MSGIVGIYHTDGHPVDALSVGRMTDTLAHRGRDGRGVWCDGAVGLGHRMFFETPESLLERQPLEDKEAGLVLTADARIDNRDDLIHQLGLTGENPAQITDARLILASYAKWGEDCVDHLIGDFAFVIWDARRRALFCARDYIGTKSFYYGFAKNRFIFASELKAILCLDESPRELNEETIADYLTVELGDREETFFQGLLRLPPAHAMRVDGQGLHLRRYWEPDATRVLRLKSDSEYADAFRESFAEAVRCRLRSAYPVGSALSGGMDSSSIACMGRDLLAQQGRGRTLKTFSATFDHLPGVDEQRYQDAVIAAGGIESHKVPMNELGPLQTYVDGQRQMDYPYLGATYYLDRGMSQQAQEHGARVFLCGHGGDDVVSHGVDYLADLVRHFRLVKCYRECRALAERHGVPLSRILRYHVLQPTIPKPVLSLWRRVRGRQMPKPPFSGLPILPGFLQRTRVLERSRERDLLTKHSPTLREEHAGLFTNGLYTFTFELVEQLSYEYSLVTRYPFFDRRLAEFCLSLPHGQKLNDGFTRAVLHRAMEGVLPTEVQWRVGKSDLEPHFLGMLRGKERSLLLQILADLPAELAEYVDMKMLRDRCARFLSLDRGDSGFLRSAWTAITLGIWLRTGFRARPGKGGMLTPMAGVLASG